MDDTARIEELATLLNAPRLVGNGWLRRNVAQYEFVTYANHIIAMYYTQNLDRLPLFLRRAARYLDSDSAAYLTEEYCAIASEFIAAMSTYMLDGRTTSDQMHEWAAEALALAQDGV